MPSIFRIRRRNDTVAAHVATAPVKHGPRQLTLVFDLQKVLCSEVLVSCISPQVLAHDLMQLLSKGFCQAVSQCFYHDVVVIITLKTGQCMGGRMTSCSWSLAPCTPAGHQKGVLGDAEVAKDAAGLYASADELSHAARCTAYNMPKVTRT